MNTQYFSEIIAELNRISPYLAQYQAYVNKVLLAENLSCVQLTELSAQTAEKLLQSSEQISAISAKAASEISSMQSNISTALTVLAPLLISPTNLAELLTWAGSVIATYAGPQASLIAQEAILVTQLSLITTAVTDTTNSVASLASSLTTAIQDAKNLKGCS